jgi:hypothetical protein
VVWSTLVLNDQDTIGQLIDRVDGCDATWGIDLLGSETAVDQFCRWALS